MSFPVALLTRVPKTGLPISFFYLCQKDDHRRRIDSSVNQLRGVCKEVLVVGVHLVDAKVSKLIERDKAGSQAMMVMSGDLKLTNFEKCYKDHIFYGSDE